MTKANSPKTAIKLPRRKLEKQLQQQGSDYLALDGWRRIKTDLEHLRGMGVQEPGMADDIFLRYWASHRTPQPHDQRVNSAHLASGNEILWIEWKCSTGVLSQKQKDWHSKERSLGALTWIAGIDFPATFDGFKAHYQKSGLARKVR